MQETFNPSRAAKQIDVPPSTLRLWAKVYAEFLSEGANPAPGEERRFTSADVEVLKAVNQLRHNGMLPADIAQRLRNNAAGSQQEAAESISSAVPQGNTQLAPTESIVALSVTKLDALGDKLTDIDRRIERIESRRNTWLLVLAAFVAGVLLVVAIVVILRMIGI